MDVAQTNTQVFARSCPRTVKMRFCTWGTCLLLVKNPAAGSLLWKAVDVSSFENGHIVFERQRDPRSGTQASVTSRTMATVPIRVPLRFHGRHISITSIGLRQSSYLSCRSRGQGMQFEQGMMVSSVLVPIWSLVLCRLFAD